MVAPVAAGEGAAVSLGIGETVLRLALATAAAAVIGWERERKNRPAGLRTHMLVGLGACLFTLLAIDGYDQLGRAQGVDPLRVVDGIVGGVGFLGAGAILQSRGAVKGLTTAAGIWVVAAIGVAAALGSYATLAATIALTAVTLTVVARLERSIHGERPSPSDQRAATGDAAARDEGADTSDDDAQRPPGAPHDP